MIKATGNLFNVIKSKRRIIFEYEHNSGKKK